MPISSRRLSDALFKAGSTEVDECDGDDGGMISGAGETDAHDGGGGGETFPDVAECVSRYKTPPTETAVNSIWLRVKVPVLSV